MTSYSWKLTSWTFCKFLFNPCALLLGLQRSRFLLVIQSDPIFFAAIDFFDSIRYDFVHHYLLHFNNWNLELYYVYYIQTTHKFENAEKKILFNRNCCSYLSISVGRLTKLAFITWSSAFCFKFAYLFGSKVSAMWVLTFNYY